MSVIFISDDVQTISKVKEQAYVSTKRCVAMNIDRSCTWFSRTVLAKRMGEVQWPLDLREQGTWNI